VCDGPSDEECSTCIDNVFLLNDTICTYDCPKKMFARDETFCTHCAKPCTACDGETTEDCSGCVEGYYLDETSCKKCMPNCEVCDSALGCLVCAHGTY
jgi:hypothetical protein